MPSRKRMSRDMRKNIIMGVVLQASEPLRVLQIARAMGMKRSEYLTTLLDELVYDGKLEVVTVEVAPDLPARAYIPTARTSQLSTPPASLTKSG